MYEFTYAIICIHEVIVMSFNQKEYIGKYNKDTYKMIPFRVRKDDVDVINKLESVSSVNKYILSF